jgi:hypothetical protein
MINWTNFVMSAKKDLPTGPIITKESLFQDKEADEFFDRARTRSTVLG